MSAALSQIFSLVLDASLAATVLLTIVLVAQLCLRKVLSPSWRYILLAAVVVRLFIPAVPESAFSIFNLGMKRPVRIVISAPPVLPEIIRVSPLASPRPPEPQPITFATAAPLIWFSGVLIWMALLLIQHRRTAKWVRRQEPISDPIALELLATVRLELRLRGRVKLVRTNSDMAPALFGSIGPVLLLPGFMLQNLTCEELRLVFLHELLHVKRHDLLLNWLSVLARAVHWFNPAAWFLVRQLRIERELACDQHVLRRIRDEDRKLYGNLLLKMVNEFPTPLRPATLIPIIQRKPKIERRISMISNYKPLPWALSIVSALVLAVAALLTFTRAAEKSAPTKRPETQNRPSEKESSAISLKNLRDQIDRQRALVSQLQHEADEMRQQLGITDPDQKTGVAAEIEHLHHLEALRSNAQAEQLRNAVLYRNLTNLTHTQLKGAALTAVSDPLLSSLLEQEQNTKQKLADVMENYAPDHPEVKRTSKVLKQIDVQIEDRLQGIITGLKSRMSAEDAHVESLEGEIRKSRDWAIQKSIRGRPYYDTVHELDLQQQVLDRLKLRLADEQINAALAK